MNYGDVVEQKKKGTFKILSVLVALGAVSVLVLAGYVSYLNTPPTSFSSETIVSIEKGESVRTITEKLEDQNVVRSGAFLYFIIAFFYEPENIKASTYVFNEALTTDKVAEQLTLGDFDSDLLRFTHYEGERATHIADRAAELLPNFNPEVFIALAEPAEGRLFPDTYFIPETYTAEELYNLMTEAFVAAISPYAEQIETSYLSLDEIITLASIIEREANSPESMRTVSGILQNRLKINMPLQADASIEYVLDKPLSELTPEDLDIDSPYNTYLNIGLPPTPIGNPGTAAISAVLEPIESDYFYYITDDEGVFHYARTYREHQSNIEIYLR